MKTKRSRTVFEETSEFGGTVRVIEDHRERRLMVHGETLSVYPLDGDWRDVRREYWWHALVERRLPRQPPALIVGLGGRTQLHLPRRVAKARTCWSSRRARAGAWEAWGARRGPPKSGGQLLEAEAVRCLGVGAEAAFLVGLVVLVVALEPHHAALVLEGEHVRGDAVEE